MNTEMKMHVLQSLCKCLHAFFYIGFLIFYIGLLITLSGIFGLSLCQHESTHHGMILRVANTFKLIL